MHIRNFLVRVIVVTFAFIPHLIQAQTPPAPSADLSSFIRTPPAPRTPRINGPHVYGERPGRPFLYHLPVTGDRPITYTAEGLPDGLVLDKATGNITGSVPQAGTYAVKFTATNALGQDSKTISLIIGPTICLTPPMGWNSWNFYGHKIDESKIRSAAEAMVKTGLIDHGWTYINTDDVWTGQRDADGNIRASAGFPDIKGMADYIHGLGLKAGIYSSPGDFTCTGGVGCFGHEDQDVRTFASWGMDYFKYDWCSYRENVVTEFGKKYALALPGSATKIIELSTHLRQLMARHDLNPPSAPQASVEERKRIVLQMKPISAELDAIYHQLDSATRDKIETECYREPYQKMRASLDKVNRDMVYSLCQYGLGNVEEWGADVGGNTWRVTEDINSSWGSVESHGFELKPGMEKWASPGHWNDPDMLEVGNGHLTPDENYTHMTQWCILSAPLLIGCNMPKMSPFIVSLFSNDEVLAVDQDSLGKQGTRAKQVGTTEVWSKPLDDGSLAVAFYNRGPAPADVAIAWTDLGLAGRQSVRDLWRQKAMGTFDSGYSVQVASHGAELFKISPSAK